MSVSLYDEALYNKIQGWVKDKRMRILKPDETLRQIQIGNSDDLDQPLTLPFISIAREPNIAVNYLGKKPMSFDGLLIQATKERSMPINAIPIVINYQIDIYTKEFKTADEFVRNMMFNLVNHPKLTIEIPYNNLKYKHDCNVRVNSPLQDNSDIPQRLFSGQFTRWTISVTIDDAYLFSVPVENNVYIEDIDVEAKFEHESK